MKQEDFWNLIEKNKASKTSAKDLAKILRKLPSAEIKSFKWHFENLYSIAERVDLYYAAYMLIGFCNEEIFSHFIGALIARGKDMYVNTLRNPDSLREFWGDADVIDDAFRYVPEQIYRKRKGRNFPNSCWSFSDEYRINEKMEFPPEANWNFYDEDENRKNLPLLSKSYYESDDPFIHRDGVVMITLPRHSMESLEKTYEVLKIEKINTSGIVENPVQFAAENTK